MAVKGMSPVIARRLAVSLLAVACTLVGAIGLPVATASAAAPEAPLLEVSRRGPAEAGLRGVLYPNATGEPGSYEFLYKQSATECTGASKTAPGLATGNQSEEASQTLTGLAAGERYTVCLAVTSPGGTSLSLPVTFIAPIAVEAPTGLKAEPIAAFTATLNGTLNSLAERKAEPGGYEFLYRQSSSECEGEGGLATPFTKAVGAKAETVSAPISELLPHTMYTFCLRAFNENGESATSSPVTFTTRAAAPKIDETGASQVTAESATLIASIDPEGAETSYTFEYAPAGGTFVPVPEAHGTGALAEGTSGVRVSAHLQGLSARSSYEFRVTAVNAVESVTSAVVSFSTQVAGTSFALPDGREWEMVSPPQKEGSLFEPLGEGTTQAAADGNAFEAQTYFEPIEGKAAGAFGYLESDLFGRGADGWESMTITPPHSTAKVAISNGGNEYHFFSKDLSAAVLEPFGPATPLTSGVSESTLYLRTDYLGGNPAALCHEACFQALINDNNVPAGTRYGEEHSEPCAFTHCGPVVLAASPDLSHVVIHSEVPLVEGAKIGEDYEWSDGHITVIGAGLIGSENGRCAACSPRAATVRHVISDDGSRVFINGSAGGMGGLLLRDTVTGETAQIAPQGNFEDASADGSRVFFTSPESLTPDAREGGLYEYNVNAPAGSHLTDLSVDPNAAEAAGVSDVVGASEDGSYVYFDATGVLAPGATPAECSGEQACENLYVRHDGVTKFIAGLGSEERTDYSSRDGGFTSEVSPNGQWTSFMSDRDLVGYDTRDAVSGRPDEEVYLYDAVSGKLVCASCNPAGARPRGYEFGVGGGFRQGSPRLSDDKQEFNSNTWIASKIPSMQASLSAVTSQSRYTLDGGRVFFDSYDALVPQDVNGTEDVYEYEPAGVGDCSRSQATFSEASGGCVSLISSGESSEESVFLDASETGGDVFFLTASKLVSRDTDNELDVYDARECGSDRSRCFPVEQVSPPPCSTGDSCKPAPSPQPAIFGSPASSTFNGAGNVEATSAQPGGARPHGSTKTQRLASALKACHRIKRGRRRERCERGAHSRYGNVSSHKTNPIGGKGR